DRLKKDFESIHVNTKVASLSGTGDGVVAALEGKDVPAKATFDRVLVAVGRRPNSQGLGLDKTKVELDAKGYVVVDKQRRTRGPPGGGGGARGGGPSGKRRPPRRRSPSRHFSGSPPSGPRERFPRSSLPTRNWHGAA